MTQTITQTIHPHSLVQRRTLRIIPEEKTKLEFDPSISSSPSNSSHSSRSSPSSLNVDECSQIVRVLTHIDIEMVRKKPQSILMKSADGTNYRVLVPKENLMEKLESVLDKGELQAFAPTLMEFVHNKMCVRWVSANRYIPTRVFLVRCKNDYIKYVLAKELTRPANIHAYHMYVLRENVSLLPSQEKLRLLRKSHYHVEMAERAAMKLVKELAQCKMKEKCTEVMHRACHDASRHPDLLKMIYHVGVSQGIDANLSWEEICFASEKKGDRVKSSAQASSRTRK